MYTSKEFRGRWGCTGLDEQPRSILEVVSGVINTGVSCNVSMLNFDKKEKDYGLEMIEHETLVGNLIDGGSDGKGNEAGISDFNSDFGMNMKSKVTERARLLRVFHRA